jgi:hypothetical protein
MYRAIAIKELRETWWIGALGGGVMLCLALSYMGLSLDDRPPFLYWRQNVNPGWLHPVPFESDEWPLVMLACGGMAAVVTALWQTLGESVQGTWLFYLYRPATRQSLLLSKLAVGLGWVLLMLGLPWLLYSLWAATPGTHASPFEWWMAGPTVRAWGYASVAYLAAFLCGLRPARWWGSRLFPAVFACFLWLPIVVVPWAAWPMWAVIAISDAVLVAAILWVTQTRDWA